MTTDNTEQLAKLAYDYRDKPFKGYDKSPVVIHPEGTTTKMVRRTFPSPNGTLINVTQEHTYPDGTVWGTRGSTPGKWQIRWDRPPVTSGPIQLARRGSVTASSNGRVKHKIDPEWLRAQYESGRTQGSIAAEVGCSITSVCKAMAKAGIPTRPPQSKHTAKLTDDQVREIRKRYAAGEKLAALSKELGVTKNTIYTCATYRSYKDVPDENGALPKVAKPSKPKGKANFTDDQVREIRRLRAEGASLIPLGKRYGVAHNTIRAICLRKTYKHVSD